MRLVREIAEYHDLRISLSDQFSCLPQVFSSERRFEEVMPIQCDIAFPNVGTDEMRTINFKVMKVVFAAQNEVGCLPASMLRFIAEPYYIAAAVVQMRSICYQ